ncbi:hypothetical protein [Acidovorax sp. sic0104]|uniref:hypothetical protein n=1 Tax=Acidovorax sp. sic0104 TaxID=2854784 RepID=UPI001C47AAE7|nr:hypothetical protein [Acidovorax sp. sic0104]
MTSTLRWFDYGGSRQGITNGASIQQLTFRVEHLDGMAKAKLRDERRVHGGQPLRVTLRPIGLTHEGHADQFKEQQADVVGRTLEHRGAIDGDTVLGITGETSSAHVLPFGERRRALLAHSGKLRPTWVEKS